MSDTTKTKIRTPVWDIATRLFHWTLALCVPAMWLLAENNFMDLHKTLGILIVGLVVFRLTWGIWGSTTARFAQFAKSPGAIFVYLKKFFQPDYKPSFGHNPLGALAVFAMIAALIVQLSAGLFAVDTDGMNSGPLSRFVSFEFGRQASDVHELAFNVLVALIAIHIIAILFYRFIKHVNLITPMITGKMDLPAEDAEKARLKKPGPVLLLISLALAAAAVAWLYSI